MHQQIAGTQQRRHVGIPVESDRSRTRQQPSGHTLQPLLKRPGAGDHQFDVLRVTAAGDRPDQRDMVLLIGQSSRRDDTERHRRRLVRLALPLRREPRFVAVGDDMQLRLVSMRAQQARTQFGRHMHMVDLAVQPYVEQPVDERVDAGHIFQRPRGIRDVLRLHVVAGRNGDAHLFGDLAGMLAETERRVDMHHVHTIERLAKQRVARLGELHLLLLRHPADQRHMIDARGIFGRADAHQTDMMPLALQLLRPLQRRWHNRSHD